MRELLSLDEITHRFPRSARLTTAASYQALFRHASARSSDSVFVVLAANNKLAIARLGLAITKKKTRHATQRNRLKRIIRESFRHHQQKLSGLDIVVVGQAGAERKPSAQLFDALRRHWDKISEQCKRSSSS